MNKLINLINIILKFLTKIRIIKTALPFQINLIRIIYVVVIIITIFSFINLNLTKGWLGWNNLGVILPLLLLSTLFRLYTYIVKSGFITKLVVKLYSLFKK